MIYTRTRSSKRKLRSAFKKKETVSKTADNIKKSPSSKKRAPKRSVSRTKVLENKFDATKGAVLLLEEQKNLEVISISSSVCSSDVIPESSSESNSVSSSVSSSEGSSENVRIEGTWELDNIDGQVFIDNGSASFFADGRIDADDLELESDDGFQFVYTGEADNWEDCDDDFEVTLTIEYNSETDALDGEIDVQPKRDVEYGPYSAFGGSINFTASRKRS